MRVGLLSDTHGVLDARVLDAVAGCALVVHAGDIGSGAVLDALEAVSDRVVAVRGNNDVPGKWPAGTSGDRLASLPSQATVDVPGGMLAVVHGDRALPARARHRKLRDAFPDARLVVYGHSHRLCVDRDEAPWVVNPGAAGRARTFGGPSLVLLDAGARRWTLRELRFRPH